MFCWIVCFSFQKIIRVHTNDPSHKKQVVHEKPAATLALVHYAYSLYQISFIIHNPYNTYLCRPSIRIFITILFTHITKQVTVIGIAGMDTHGYTSCCPEYRVESTKDNVGTWFNTKLAKTTEFALFIVNPRKHHQTNRNSET